MAATSPIRISPCVPCTHAYTAFPAARATRTPSPAYACGGCYQRVSSQTRVYPALWVYPAVLSTLLLELVVAVELLAVAQSLRVPLARPPPVAAVWKVEPGTPGSTRRRAGGSRHTHRGWARRGQAARIPTWNASPTYRREYTPRRRCGQDRLTTSCERPSRNAL